MRVERDLLLLASGWVVVCVRVEVAALGVNVPDRNLGTKCNICECILHPSSTERMLERRAHEAIAVSRAVQDMEVNREHGEVKHEGDEDKA